MAASPARTTPAQAGTPGSSARRSPVANTAPKITWPSMPMFHTPAAKVRSNPAAPRHEPPQLLNCCRPRVERRGDAAAEEDQDAIAAFEELVQIGRGKEDRRAAPAPFQHMAPDGLCGFHVEAAGGVLHQEHGDL